MCVGLSEEFHSEEAFLRKRKMFFHQRNPKGGVREERGTRKRLTCDIRLSSRTRDCKAGNIAVLDPGGRRARLPSGSESGS